MSSEPAQTPESVDATADKDPSPASVTRPWATLLSVIACIGIFAGLAAQNDYESPEALSKFGYLPADSIWNGGYWALVTSTFVHFEIWHLAFNVYWLWVLGGQLERAIGSLRFLAFFLVAAFVSSSFELAMSDGTGIGASGVVYAIFGFMWPARHRYPSFNTVLDTRTIQIFVFWLVGCVIATYLKIWEVGNAAHISGLLFGGGVAGAFVLRFLPRLVRVGLVSMVALSVVPLFWCPWSVAWLSHKAYTAHVAERYSVALDWYTRVIQMDPKSAWAYLNRSTVYQALGRPEKAQADLMRAREIDPSIERRE
jgi:GlpG protein